MTEGLDNQLGYPALLLDKNNRSARLENSVGRNEEIIATQLSREEAGELQNHLAQTLTEQFGTNADFSISIQKKWGGWRVILVKSK